MNPRGLLSITILRAHYQTFELLGAYYYKRPWVLTKNIIFSYRVGHIHVHTHRLARATSEKTACDIRAGIKLRLNCTVCKLIYDFNSYVNQFRVRIIMTLTYILCRAVHLTQLCN